MTYSMNQLKKGLKIEMDGIPYRITEYQHVKPGKGAAFVRCKIKNFLNAKVIDKTFHAGDKCQTPDLVNKEMQFSYDDGEMLQFMDSITFEQLGLTYEQVGDTINWIIEGMNVNVLFHNDKAISVDAPEVVELEITDTPPNFKGDSSGGKKPATLESGAVIQIPFHILTGDRIRVNTVDKSYLDKVK